MNKDIRTIFIDAGHYAEVDYPLTIKPNFSTIGSFVEILPQGAIITLVINDNVGSLLGFHETKLWQEYNLSPNPVDISSFDKIFLVCDIAQGMIYEGKRSGIFHNFTMDNDPGYKSGEKF